MLLAGVSAEGFAEVSAVLLAEFSREVLAGELVELSEAALWELLDEWVLDELPLEGMMDVLDVLAEALKEMPALRDLSRLFRAFASKLTKYWQIYE